MSVWSSVTDVLAWLLLAEILIVGVVAVLGLCWVAIYLAYAVRRVWWQLVAPRPTAGGRR